MAPTVPLSRHRVATQSSHSHSAGLRRNRGARRPHHGTDDATASAALEVRVQQVQHVGIDLRGRGRRRGRRVARQEALAASALLLGRPPKQRLAHDAGRQVIGARTRTQRPRDRRTRLARAVVVLRPPVPNGTQRGVELVPAQRDYVCVGPRETCTRGTSLCKVN